MLSVGGGMTTYHIYNGNNLDVLDTLNKEQPQQFDSIVTDPPYGLSFMGKEWDHQVPGCEYWSKLLDVAKPGAYLLAFGGTRLYHRLAVAIEDAGWEIRDCLSWLYGTGFPKSLDVSKAIDKAAGAEREIIGVRHKRSPNSKYGNGAGTNLETLETVPATDDAKRWQGWGTALKPAWEPIIMARKPFKGSVAANVLQHGTGALNIDGCRTAEGTGRWPANLMLDGVAGNLLDEQAGERGGGFGARGQGGRTYGTNRTFQGDLRTVGYGDSVGASRFFYCPKASKQDRGEGNNHPTVKPHELMRHLCRLVTPIEGSVLDPFAGSGSTGVAAIAEGFSFVGIELDESYADVARKRLGQAARSVDSTAR